MKDFNIHQKQQSFSIIFFSQMAFQNIQISFLLIFSKLLNIYAFKQCFRLDMLQQNNFCLQMEKKKLFTFRFYLILAIIVISSHQRNLQVIPIKNANSTSSNNLQNNSNNSSLPLSQSNITSKLANATQPTNKNITIKNSSQSINSSVSQNSTLLINNTGDRSISNVIASRASSNFPDTSTASDVSSDILLTSQNLWPWDPQPIIEPLVQPIITPIVQTIVSPIQNVIDLGASVVSQGLNLFLPSVLAVTSAYICDLPATGPRSKINPPLPPIKMPYGQYVTKYKADSTDAKDPYRATIYANNLNKINSHNTGTTRKYDMGLNEFTNLADEEFSAQFFGLIIPPELLDQPTPYANYSEPRKIKVDWGCKASAVVTQGVCGSCYIIAALDSIEMTMRMYGIPSAFPFSVQQILSCAKNGQDLNGCKGGFFKSVFDYVQTKGVGIGSTYPYDAYAKFSGAEVACNNTIMKSQSYARSRVTIRGSVLIPYGDCYSIVEQLQYRAIAVAIAASGQLQFYSKGTYTTDSTTLNHGVTLIGYDPNRGYKIRNSWGSGWGDKGYGYLDNSTGICNFAMYPQLVGEQGTPTSCC